jgi:hypothetical protein
MSKTLFGTVLALVLCLAACDAGSHPSAITETRGNPSSTASTDMPNNPAVAADRALCDVYNANIGNGDIPAIAQALAAVPTDVTPKLAHDIMLVTTGTSLSADLRNQVLVTLDCAIVKTGGTPGS